MSLPSNHHAPALTMNIIGAGRLGKTVGRLFQKTGLIQIQQIKNTQHKSALDACQFIHAGAAVTHWSEIKPADIWLLSCPDDTISEALGELLTNELIEPNNVVMHCSGALASQLLKPQSASYYVCSIHPVHSFVNPENSYQHFNGTQCAYEGDASALTIMLPLFEKIGAQLFEIDSDNKTLYHTATVLACNALVGLLDASLECLNAAGVAPEQAAQLLSPIVHQTVDNVLQNNPTDALTGPLVRGDIDIITNQLAATEALNTGISDIYTSLSLRLLTLAAQKGLNSSTQKSLMTLLTQAKKKT